MKDDSNDIDVEATDEIAEEFDRSETWDGDDFTDREQFEAHVCEAFETARKEVDPDDAPEGEWEGFDRVTGVGIVMVGLRDGEVAHKPFHAFDPALDTEQAAHTFSSYNEGVAGIGYQIGFRDALDRQSQPRLAGIGAMQMPDLSDLFGL